MATKILVKSTVRARAIAQLKSSLKARGAKWMFAGPEWASVARNLPHFIKSSVSETVMLRVLDNTKCYTTLAYGYPHTFYGMSDLPAHLIGTLHGVNTVDVYECPETSQSYAVAMYPINKTAVNV